MRFKIEATVENNLDSIVRALNIVRRSKLLVKTISAEVDGQWAIVRLIVDGAEDEVNWVRNKLEKLYDVVTIKYSQEDPVVVAGELGGENIQGK